MFNWIEKLFALLGFRRRQRSFRQVCVKLIGESDAAAKSGGILVLAGTVQKPKWLKFACPCGCGEILALNLMTSHSPHWKIEHHSDGTITVAPSVDATKCGAHFWIRRNRVEWC